MLFLYNYRDDRRNREAVGVSAATQSAGPKKRNCVFCSVKYSRKQMGAAVSEYFNDISKCNGECVEHKSLCMLVALSQVSGKKASWSASAWSGLFGVSCACCMSLFLPSPCFLCPLILAFSSVLTSALLHPNPTDKC